MKNLKFTLLIIGIGLFTFSNAQFKFGIAGGFNSAAMSGEDVNGSGSIPGFHGGLMTEVKLPIALGFEADVLYSTKGANFAVFFVSQDLKLNYIDIPVVAKLYMLKVTNLQLGAQYSILMSGSLAGLDVKDQYNSGDIQAVFGFGVDVSKFHGAVRYSMSLPSISSNGDAKNNVLMISLGFWLKK